MPRNDGLLFSFCEKLRLGRFRTRDAVRMITVLDREATEDDEEPGK
jgi:hypothetical protein